MNVVIEFVIELLMYVFGCLFFSGKDHEWSIPRILTSMAIVVGLMTATYMLW